MIRTDALEQDWTPKRVGEELVLAIKWVLDTGGRVGPSGIKSGMPEMMMDEYDRLEQQWDIVRPSSDGKKRRRLYTPAEVSRYDRVILWPLDYLQESPNSARAVSFWALCKARKKPTYSRALEVAGIARATAYRSRDRGLSIIALGLTKDEILRGRH